MTVSPCASGVPGTVFLLITLMTRAAHTTSLHKQTAGPVMIHLCILKDKGKNKELFRARVSTFYKSDKTRETVRE